MTGTPLVIIGAGGFGRDIYDLVGDIDGYRVLGFVDDGEPPLDLIRLRGACLLGGLAELAALPPEAQYVIAIGSGKVRRKVDAEISALGLKPATLIHPKAVLGRYANTVGDGTVICARAALTTNIHIGRHGQIHPSVELGHDGVIGDFVTVFPGATVSANVTLEDEVTIGAGATIIQGLTVGRGSYIGAGAAVVTDIPPGVVAVGVPARSRS
jgi:sugar O-acyltransferase (sialic acid O-acetyltransferase NeuD family)